jgi:hypothetical protein
VDRDVIARKIEQPRRHVARIEAKKPFRAADLAAGEDLRYASLDLDAVHRACDSGLEDLRQFGAAIGEKYLKPEGETPPGPGSSAG